MFFYHSRSLLRLSHFTISNFGSEHDKLDGMVNATLDLYEKANLLALFHDPIPTLFGFNASLDMMKKCRELLESVAAKN
jgi:hypothetical protein